MRGSGVLDTLRMGLLPWEGDCCLRWAGGETPGPSKRLKGLAEPRAAARPRLAGDGERRLGGATGERAPRPGRFEGNMGLLLCLGGDAEEGGVRLFWAGGLLRLGDLEGRRLGGGEERFAGEFDILLFCSGSGDGL